VREVLETPRLRLRRISAADDLALIAEQFAALDADPAVMRFLTGGRPTPRAEIETEVLPRLLALPTPYGRWVASERATGTSVGWFGLTPVAGPDTVVDTVADIGWRLRRASWGQGYATEGARALLAEAFTAGGLRRVVADTMTVNTASRRVMDKLGMRFVRTFFQDWGESIPGSDHGDVEYALTSEDWFRQAEDASGSGCARRADLERS
jgi:RimJ/RimL family protein N-acetyltransferase